MDFALGGPSEFSIPRTYDGDTAARALARVVSPLAIFVMWFLVKTVHSAKRDNVIERKNMDHLSQLRDQLVYDTAKSFELVGSDIDGIRTELGKDREIFSQELKKKEDKKDKEG